MKNSKQLPQKSGIYKIINLLNGHIYIGQSKNIYKRYHQHHKYEYKNEQRSDFHLYQAMRKYGLHNFMIEVVELCSEDILDEREQYWIQYYNSFKEGYNMTEGGQNFSSNIFSEETKNKRKQTLELNSSLKGENHPRAKISDNEVILIRQRYKDGESVSQIYQDYKNIYKNEEMIRQIVLGVHYKCVGNIPSKKEKNLQRGKFTEKEIIEIREKYYLQEYTQTALSKEYGVSSSTIKDIVNRTNYKEIKDDIPNLRRRKTYRLTAEEVKEIRNKYKNGVSISSLAKEYKIDNTAISKCVQRITYKNIE